MLRPQIRQIYLNVNPPLLFQRLLLVQMIDWRRRVADEWIPGIPHPKQTIIIDEKSCPAFFVPWRRPCVAPNLRHICLRELSASCVPIRTSAIAMAMIQPAPKKDDDRDDDCKCPIRTPKMSQIRAKSSWICSLKAPKMWCPSFESVFVCVQPSIRHSLALRREPCCRKLACLMIRTWMLAVAHRSGLRDPLGFSCNVV